MKTRLCLPTLLLVASAFTAAASDSETVRNAAARLQSATNYSWTANYRMASAGSGKIEGKAGQPGTALMTLEWGGGLVMEMAIQGTNGALNRDGRWQSLADVATENPRLAGMLKELKTPAGQATDLLKYAEGMKLQEGAYVAELTAAGVKELLSFGRNLSNVEVKNPKGSVKFWVKDGALTKFEDHLSGLLSIDGNERDLDIRATIELKDVGTTTFSIPEGAAKELGSRVR